MHDTIHMKCCLGLWLLGVVGEWLLREHGVSLVCLHILWILSLVFSVFRGIGLDHISWYSYINMSCFLEKAMAPHSSTLAWKIPWMEEPGRLRSMGSLRVGHDWATSLSLFTVTHWRRKWQPTPVFLPGESQGWGSLVGCCLWDHTESDTTEVT